MLLSEDPGKSRRFLDYLWDGGTVWSIRFASSESKMLLRYCIDSTSNLDRTEVGLGEIDRFSCVCSYISPGGPKSEELCSRSEVGEGRRLTGNCLTEAIVMPACYPGTSQKPNIHGIITVGHALGSSNKTVENRFSEEFDA